MGFLWVSFVGLLWFDELVIVVFLGVVWVHLCWVDFCWFCWVALLVGFVDLIYHVCTLLLSACGCAYVSLVCWVCW